MSPLSSQSLKESKLAAMPVTDRVRAVVMELCSALAAMVDGLPQPIRKAADLERALSLQTPLAWRVFRLSRATDAADAIEFLPTVKQLERVIAKAAAHVGDEAARRAEAAVERLGALMEEVGGDQRGFESLVSGLSPAGVKRVEIEHRRAAFRGNTHLWGLQARCLLACAVERPGSAPDKRDGCSIRGMLDLQTMRPDVPLMIQARMHFTACNSGHAASEPKIPVLPGQPEWMSDLNLLTQFGGPRLPRLHTEVTPDGWQRTLARVPGIGRTEAVSFYLHQSYRGAPEDDEPGLGMLVEIPTEWLHLEFLVPVGWTDPSTRRTAAYANRHDVKRAYQCRPSDRIPMHEAAQHFAARETVPPAPEVPHWPEIVRHVLKEQGWWGQKFDVYRCLVQYPMLHAWTGMLVDRPGRSGGPPNVQST